MNLNEFLGLCIQIIRKNAIFVKACHVHGDGIYVLHFKKL